MNALRKMSWKTGIELSRAVRGASDVYTTHSPTLAEDDRAARQSAEVASVTDTNARKSPEPLSADL